MKTAFNIFMFLNNLLGIQVFPNPSNGLTKILLNTPENGNLSINLIDILGREVAVIYNGSINAGDKSYMIDVNNIDTGIYFIQIKYNDKLSVIKFLID